MKNAGEETGNNNIFSEVAIVYIPIQTIIIIREEGIVNGD